MWVYRCTIIALLSKEVDMFSVRRYRASDYEAVWDLHNLALHQVGAHVSNGQWDNDLHDIETVYCDDGGEFLVGTENDLIIAMGALKRLSDTRAEITRMRVHPDHQCRGLGQVILTALEATTRRLGYKVLHLQTTTKQKAAQGLYKKNGYRITGKGKFDPFMVISYQKVLDSQSRTKKG